jgi:hypothetical protein
LDIHTGGFFAQRIRSCSRLATIPTTLDKIAACLLQLDLSQQPNLATETPSPPIQRKQPILRTPCAAAASPACAFPMRGITIHIGGLCARNSPVDNERRQIGGLKFYADPQHS